MMNRGVMDRQMFRNGGAAFPDLSGDGRVTQKDVLMGRGVIPMQQGGNPALEAGVNAAAEAFIKVMGRPPESLEELQSFCFRDGASGVVRTSSSGSANTGVFSRHDAVFPPPVRPTTRYPF